MFNTSFFQLIIIVLLVFLLFGDFSRLKKNVTKVIKKIFTKQEE